MTALEKTLSRLGALIDGSAWLLILPALAVLFVIDAPMAKTLMQWSLYFLVVAGLAVMISRIVFPHIRLDAFIQRAEAGDRAAACVVGHVVLFVGLLILAFVLWARPVGT